MKRFLKIVAGLVLIGIAGLTLYVKLQPPPAGWAARHQPVDIDPITFEEGLPWAEYLTRTTAMMSAAMESVPAGARGAIQIGLTRPLDIPPAANCDGSNRGGVLLIHGAFDSPYSMLEMAESFAAACFHARTLLIPGHGTLPGHSLNVSLEDWRAATRYGVLSFDALELKSLTVIGYSMGAALAVDAVINGDTEVRDRIDALVGVAPGVTGPEIAGFSQRALGMINNILGLRQYLSLHPDVDPVKYESGSVNIALEYVALQDAIGDPETGAPLTIPYFTVIAEDDETVPLDAQLAFFCNRAKGPRQGIVYASIEWQAPCDGLMARPGAEPSLGLLQAAHTSVLFSPANAVRGRGPDAYLDCRHYWLRDRAKYDQCRDPALTPQNSTTRYGETLADNRQRFILRRATFNPDFERMMAAMIAFLDANVGDCGGQ